MKSNNKKKQPCDGTQGCFIARMGVGGGERVVLSFDGWTLVVL